MDCWVAQGVFFGSVEPQQVDVALKILGKGGATLHPVAAIEVFEALNRSDFGAVDVTANDPLDTRLARQSHHGLLILGDVADRTLGLKFQVGGHRPISEAHPTSEPVEEQVEFEDPVVESGSHAFEQSVEEDQSIELVAVEYQITPSVQTFVDSPFHQADATQIQTQELLHEFVVVPEDIGDLRLFAVHPQDFLDHRVGLGAPKPSPTQLPAVDDVPHQVKVPALVIVQERQQEFCLAMPAPEVEVRNPNGVVLHGIDRLRPDEGMFLILLEPSSAQSKSETRRHLKFSIVNPDRCQRPTV
jgi:hypothetical protein